MAKTSSKSDRRLFKRVAALTRSCWPQLVGLTMLSLLSAPLTLLGPLPLKIAVDTVIGEQSMPRWIHLWAPQSWHDSNASRLMFAAGLLLAIALLSSAQSLLSWLLQTYTGERLVRDFRAQLLWNAQRFSLTLHDKRESSDTAFRIQYDAPAIQTLVLQGLIPLFTALFGFFAILFVTMRISPKLAAISLIMSPVLYVLARNSGKKARRGHDEITELDSPASLLLYEALSAVRLVKAFDQESHQDELFRRKSRLRMREQIRIASFQALLQVLIALSIAGGTALALVIGITQVRQNLITLGELLLVLAYMAQLYEPLRTISTKIPELQSSMSSLGRAVAILDELPEIVEFNNSTPIKRVDGTVSMRNVGFQYSAGSRRVLQDVSFEVPAGYCVGIIGASGSGKSTLINLITRSYDPVDGQVFLDGVDLRQYDPRDLRRQFSIVLQEPMLFSTSVAGNIAYGNPNASRDEVVEAAKLANAHEFIEQMSEGYNTLIGEKGLSLSGGERQRIAIAQAFLKNAPVVILDEPIGAVDVKTEASIMQGIQNLAAGRTTFMIAHRLSTLERCDMVLVMKDGRLNMVTNQVEEAREQLIESSRPQIVPFGPQGPQLVR